MAEQSIYVNLELFKQTPSYLDDAKSAIKDSLHYLSQYNTGIKSSGLRSRTTKFDVTYSAIYNNVYTASLDTAELSATCTSIVNLITSYENNTGATPVDPNINNQVTAQAEVAKATNAEVSETDEDNSVWDSIWGFFCKVGSAIAEFIEGVVATFVDLVACLLEGLFKLVETIIDATVLLTATLVSWTCSAINWIFGTKIDTNAINNWTMSFIANDFVGSVFHAFYTKTGFGRWMADNSVLYGTKVRDIIVSAVPWVGIIVIGAVVTYFSGGSATPAYVTAMTTIMGAAHSAGSAAETAYAKGDSYYAGLGKAAVNGAIGALQGYGIGKATTAAVGALKSSQSIVAISGKNGGVMALKQSGKGLGTKWNYAFASWDDMAAYYGYNSVDDMLLATGYNSVDDFAAAYMNGAAGSYLALPPGTTSTALSTFTGAGTAIGPYTGALAPKLVTGAFGIGKLAAGTALVGTAMGIKEWDDQGLTMDFAKDNTGVPIVDDNKVDDDKPPVDDDDDDNVVKPPVDDDDDDNVVKPPVDDDDDNVVKPPVDDDDDDNVVKPPVDDDDDDNVVKPPVDDDDDNNDDKPPVDDDDDNNDDKPPADDDDDNNDDKPPADDDDDNNDDKPPADDDDDNNVVKPPNDDDIDKEPNITFVNVGPKYVDVTPINSQVPETPLNPGNVNIGGTQVGVTTPPTSGDVEFSDPTGGSSGVIEVKPEVTYEFESMEPTVSNPALDNGLISSGPEVNVETNVVNPMVDSSFESVDVTSYDNITGNSITQDDPNYSGLGLGGLGLGASALFNMTRTPREEKEETKLKKSENKDEDKI